MNNSFLVAAGSSRFSVDLLPALSGDDDPLEAGVKSQGASETSRPKQGSEHSSFSSASKIPVEATKAVFASLDVKESY